MRTFTHMVSLSLIGIFLTTITACFAGGKWTSEQSALHAVEQAMQIVVEKQGGLPPTNWAQVQAHIDLTKLNQQVLTKSSAYPLQEHYVFVTDKIPVPGVEMGDVILIRTSSVKNGEGEEEREGRYIISKHDGVLKSTWLAETNVQKMLADAGVTELPKPEPLNTLSNATGAVPVRDLSLTPTTNSARIVPQVEPAAVEPASASQGAEPASSAVAQTSPASPAPSAGSASFLKMFVVPLMAVLGLAAGFILFRSRK